MKARTQQDLILRHLKRRPITGAQAFEQYGVYRLADVVFKLRNDGHIITTETVADRNRFGHAVKYARYRLKAIPRRVWEHRQPDGTVAA